MTAPDFEISVRSRRWSCVVDPLLALATPLGAQLVQRLAPVMDLWVVRTFWQALDASEFYRRDPLAFWPAAERGRLAGTETDVDAAIALWERVRAGTDLAHCRLHWVSDNLSESSLADGAPDGLIGRYEALHQALAGRADPADELTESAGFYGLLDTLALAAALGPVRVLTLDPGHRLSTLPGTSAALGLRLSAIDDPELLPPERARLRELLVESGAAPLLWAGLPLAVLHVLLPAAVPVAVASPVEAGLGLSGTSDYDDLPEPPPRATDRCPWQGAVLFHYALTGAGPG